MPASQNQIVEAFLKHAERDARLLEQLQQVSATGARRRIDIVRIAASAGFHFSTHEYEQATRARMFAKYCLDHAPEASSSLSEDDGRIQPTPELAPQSPFCLS
jgi:hypothetical protein